MRTIINESENECIYKIKVLYIYSPDAMYQMVNQCMVCKKQLCTKFEEIIGLGIKNREKYILLVNPLGLIYNDLIYRLQHCFNLILHK